jgi:general L-amino acid transport system substrate-binding protein
MRCLLAVSMAVAFVVALSAAAPARSLGPNPRQNPPPRTNGQTAAGPQPGRTPGTELPANPPQPARANGQTIDVIRAARHLDCGTVSEADDWNRADLHGNLSALGRDICRAVAVAILGNMDGLTIHEFPAEPEALTALKAGAIQLAATISPDTTIAMQYGVGFGPPIFYDTQRLLTSRAAGINQLAGLRDQLICVLALTQPAQTLRDEMASRGIPYAVMAHSEQGEMDAAIAVHHCVAGTGMESRLAESRRGFHARTSDFEFLPDRFDLEPVVPAYRYGDQTFGLIVDWTIHALIEAEALGITQTNVGESAGREDMRAQRLLGGDFATAQALGLAHDWAAKVIAALGNYGEIFERTTGRPYHLERGLNRLWTEGGLMRPVPIR